MIDELRGLAIFVAVAGAGSFSAAGRRLGLAPSGVSQHVANLEDRLGVTLFYRSTRSLSLTSEGARLLKHAQKMVAAADDGLNEIAGRSSDPSGSLSVSMPAFMAGSIYEQRIWEFLSLYPGVHLELRQADQELDLVAEGIDLALRMGELADSALVSRRIGDFGRRLVAAPAYVRKRGRPETPQDLLRFDFIAMKGLRPSYTLKRGNDEVTVNSPKGRVMVDSFSALRNAICSGLGIQRLPDSVAKPDLDSGRLVELLKGWELITLGTYAVWPDKNRRSSLTRLLVDHLAKPQGTGP